MILFLIGVVVGLVIAFGIFAWWATGIRMFD